MTVDDLPRAVPAFIDNLAVVYNKKIFDDAGVDYPTDDWTWDDFLKTAAELNDPDAGIAGFGWPGTGDEDTTWRIWPLVWQQGGDIVSEDGDSVGFDGASGEAALDVVAAGGLRRLGLHRQHRRQRAHAAALRQRQDGDERRRARTRCPSTSTPRSTTGSRSMPSFGDEHTTIAGPDTWAIFDNGDERVGRGARVHGLVQPARAAAALDQRGRQPAADQRRPGRPGLRGLREEPARASTSSSRTPTWPGPGRRSPSTRRSPRRWARRSPRCSTARPTRARR